MRTDKSDIHDAIGIVNPNHQPVFIPGKIEYDPAVFQDAGALEIRLNFSGRCPVSFDICLYQASAGWMTSAYEELFSQNVFKVDSAMILISKSLVP